MTGGGHGSARLSSVAEGCAEAYIRDMPQKPKNSIRKQALVNATGQAARFLDTGERQAAVLRGDAGLDPLLLLFLSEVILLGLLAAAIHWDVPPIWQAAGFVACIVLFPGRRVRVWFVLTDRRVLEIRQDWLERKKVIATHPLAEVRIDAVRSRFPLRGTVGFRWSDGSTTRVIFSRAFLPEVEWLASCLDAGVAAPRRPDVLSA
jgi:hypothetical protein